MKRDMELMRKILFSIENEFEEGQGTTLHIEIKGYSMKNIAEHCDLLYQAGLINEYNKIENDSGLNYFYVGNLTNYGFDYLELIKNEEIWEKTNKEVDKKKLPKNIETIGKIAASILGTFMREYNR